MASIKPDITLIRGDTSSIDFEFTSSGSAIDLTGATVFFTAKPDLTNDTTDSTAVISVEVTSHTDPENGQTIIPLTDDDTDVTPGIYLYDIQLKRADGTITSIPARKLEVVADVTRRES
jgi:hypothetical protein